MTGGKSCPLRILAEVPFCVSHQGKLYSMESRLEVHEDDPAVESLFPPGRNSGHLFSCVVLCRSCSRSSDFLELFRLRPLSASRVKPRRVVLYTKTLSLERYIHFA